MVLSGNRSYIRDHSPRVGGSWHPMSELLTGTSHAVNHPCCHLTPALCWARGHCSRRWCCGRHSLGSPGLWTYSIYRAGSCVCWLHWLMPSSSSQPTGAGDGHAWCSPACGTRNWNVQLLFLMNCSIPELEGFQRISCLTSSSHRPKLGVKCLKPLAS